MKKGVGEEWLVDIADKQQYDIAKDRHRGRGSFDLGLLVLDHKRPTKSAMKTQNTKIREDLIDKLTLSPKKKVNFYHT